MKLNSKARQLLWALILAGGLFCLLLLTQVLSQQLVARAGSHRVAVHVIVYLLAIGLFLVIYTSAVRRVEKRQVTELWGRPIARDLVLGLCIGIGLFTTVVLILRALGLARITIDPNKGFPAVAFAAAALAGVSEELVFRGALYRLLQSAYGTLIALLVSSLLFGGLHLINPGATAASALAVALEAGTLLGLVYTATGSLPVAIGLHFGWDCSESAIFGALESGTQHHGWLHTTVTGPNYLSGGSFGPEGSLVAIAVCLVAAAVLMYLALKRRTWVDSR